MTVSITLFMALYSHVASDRPTFAVSSASDVGCDYIFVIRCKITFLQVSPAFEIQLYKTC